MKDINIQILVQMLQNGCRKVIAHQEQINAINIFPIPDSDTGSNLAHTLHAIEKVIGTQSFADIQQAKHQILASVLQASQGNSGMLMTSWLSGFLENLVLFENLEITALAGAFDKGAKSARSAVEHPVKGAILDVMDAAAEAFKTTDGVSHAFQTGIKAVEKALIATEEEMKLLHEHHVIDAGALGWSYFFAGMAEIILEKEIHFPVLDTKVQGNVTLAKDAYIFEVIFLVTKPTISNAEMHELFSSLGDSLDIVVAEEQMKVHIHTNEPEMVKELAHTVGTITYITTTDMRKQVVHH